MTADPLGPTALRLDPGFVRQEVCRYLAEDVGAGDVTTALVVEAGARAAGRIVAREACVVAGLPVAQAVFAALDGDVHFESLVEDGAGVREGASLARLRGPAAPILTGERVALNILQRLCGIATLTRRFADALVGTGASVSDTRKTTPGLRLFEKYAVRVGGGRNHRIGLYDAVLIKDNHIVAAGGLDRVLRTLAGEPPSVPVQLEVDSVAQLEQARAAGVKAFLLDNMTPEEAADAVRLVRRSPGGADCWIEASGGITLNNVRAYAEAGVDTISVGALTHSSPSVDLALDFDALGAAGGA